MEEEGERTAHSIQGVGVLWIYTAAKNKHQESLD